MNTPHPQWIIPDWPVPAQVRALVTTRAGGSSSGPYLSMNLGRRTADDPAAVEANHAQLNQMLPAPPRWLAQVHGSTVVDADMIGNTNEVPQADASVARRPGTVCAILVADCLPVLFTDRAGTCIAAAHAGWRGLAGGVLANTVARMPVQAADLMAWIGPGIGPTAFEVGNDVLQAFCNDAPVLKSAFKPLPAPGKWLCDLPALARDALRRAGVTEVYGGDLCTYTDPQRFYSHRRNPVTGRMAALLWLTRGGTSDTV